jgi:hypothetical protein
MKESHCGRPDPSFLGDIFTMHFLNKNNICPHADMFVYKEQK